MATATKDVSLNKKVSQFFWRSWAIQASWNYERQMIMGFLYGMVPTLDRQQLWPDQVAGACRSERRDQRRG